MPDTMTQELQQLAASIRELSARAATAIATVRATMPALSSAIREVTRSHGALAEFRCSDTTGLHENVVALEMGVEQRLDVLNRFLTEAHTALAKLPVAAREFDAGVTPFLDAIGKPPSAPVSLP